jgi:hypothetical protein
MGSKQGGAKDSRHPGMAGAVGITGDLLQRTFPVLTPNEAVDRRDPEWDTTYWIEHLQQMVAPCPTSGQGAPVSSGSVLVPS